MTESNTRFRDAAGRALLASLLISAAAPAAELRIPNTFAPDTPARAAEVNANFQAVRSAVNDNDGRLVTVERDTLTALEAIADLYATATCPPGTPQRFTDNGDGTVCDSATGLMWEVKEACGGLSDPANPRCVRNAYTWSQSGNDADGTVYTDFLSKLNDLENPNDGAATPCLAAHCDWRVPKIAELRSIVRAPAPFCGDNAITPCLAEGFPGPTGSLYWSSTTLAADAASAWGVDFANGSVSAGFSDKRGTLFVRAVRGGR